MIINLLAYLQNTPILPMNFKMTFSAEDINIKVIGSRDMAGLMMVITETGRHIGNRLLVVGRSF